VAFDNAVDALELSQRTFPPMRWIIPGVIPTGATLLAAPEKIGKSWWALQLARAISTQGSVLYLALEDTEESLHWRLGQQPGVNLSTLTLVPQGSALPLPKGATQISQWLVDAHNPLLVIVDTLEKLRGEDKGNGRQYRADYQAVASLKMVADKHGVALLFLHHLNQNETKMGEEPGDPVYRVSGTSGLTGAADTIITLQRDRLSAEGALFTTGRRVATSVQGLVWDDAQFLWSITAPPAMPRNVAHDLVAAHGPMSRADVCKRVGTSWAVRRVEDALVLGLLVEAEGLLRLPYHQPLASPIQCTKGMTLRTNAITAPAIVPNTIADLHSQSRMLTSPLPGSSGVP
jgi:hypothetical protein